MRARSRAPDLAARRRIVVRSHPARLAACCGGRSIAASHASCAKSSGEPRPPTSWRARPLTQPAWASSSSMRMGEVPAMFTSIRTADCRSVANPVNPACTVRMNRRGVLSHRDLRGRRRARSAAPRLLLLVRGLSTRAALEHGFADAHGSLLRLVRRRRRRRLHLSPAVRSRRDHDWCAANPEPRGRAGPLGFSLSRDRDLAVRARVPRPARSLLAGLLVHARGGRDPVRARAPRLTSAIVARAVRLWTLHPSHLDAKGLVAL